MEAMVFLVGSVESTAIDRYKRSPIVRHHDINQMQDAVMIVVREGCVHSTPSLITVFFS